MNQQVSKGHRWKPGQSGNPAGRPLGARHRIAEKLLTDLESAWAKHGETVLDKLAISDPGKFATIAYGVLPKDVFLSVQQDIPGGLDADAWHLMRSVLDTIQRALPEGDKTPPADVFAVIDDALRGHFAKVIRP